jgi:DNA-binding transcriptional regulator YhcF (GntR family)
VDGRPFIPASLPEQITGCVHRSLRSGELGPGNRLVPAQELAAALGVDRNTVLTAYRGLREAGGLEFRRGRGVRIATTASAGSAIEAAARDLIKLARQHGYDRAELLRIVEESP